MKQARALRELAASRAVKLHGVQATSAIACVLLVAILAACSSEGSPRSPSPTPVAETRDDGPYTRARVVAVVDGATIDAQVEDKVFRVRYLGIQIPEGGSLVDGMTIGERALEYNRFLVGNGIVELERGAVDTDPYGVLLRYVYVNGEMVNLALLTNGYASVADFPRDFKHRTDFAVAEESAKREQRGFWSPPPDSGEPAAASASPTPVTPFAGGTLPLPPGSLGRPNVCDFSNTATPVIKGNVEKQTGNRVYHVPGGIFYSTTEVLEKDGDRWFCTEEEATAAGWVRSKH